MSLQMLLPLPGILLYLDNYSSLSKTHLKDQPQSQTFYENLNHPEVPRCGSKNITYWQFHIVSNVLPQMEI